MDRRAFTLIELCVCLFVVALLAALIAAGVQQSRETARLMQCRSNLHQLGVAISAFEAAKGHYPPGWGQADTGYLFHLLPYVDQAALAKSFDISLDPIELANHEIYRTRIPLYLCPSDPKSDLRDSGGTVAGSYAGNFGTGVLNDGYNGLFALFGLNGKPMRPIRPQDIQDGLSQTAAVSEILAGDGTLEIDVVRAIWHTPTAYPSGQLEAFAESCDSMAPAGTPFTVRGRPWTRGDVDGTLYNHVLTPNRKSCYDKDNVQEGIYTAASLHKGGVNMLLGDGRVEFVSERVDRNVWRAFGSRNGGERNP